MILDSKLKSPGPEAGATSGASFELACVIIWKLWEIRNSLIHGEDKYLPADIIKWSSDFLDSYRRANLPDRLYSTARLPDKWSAPPDSHLKINFDAALFADSHFQVAVVARDWTGNVVK